MLAMMGDNIEHVISYWVMFQSFQSPVLAGYAVVSHWLPFLLFSVYSGSLADRYDCRRLTQLSMLMFAAVSVCWGLLFITGTLEVWHTLILLAIHGWAGVLWFPATSLIVYDVVGRDDLQSGVRLSATARQLGILMGPAIGGGLMLAFGPGVGILTNALVYLPLVAWCMMVPHTGHRREALDAPRGRAVGVGDAVSVLHEVSSNRVVLSMILLSGAIAITIGNAFQSLMPEFAVALNSSDTGKGYTVLQLALAAGAVVGGLVLEAGGFLRPRAMTAILGGALFALSVLGFALARNYAVALLLLVAVGALRIAVSSMAQALVQLRSPVAMQGRVMGVFSMAQSGLQVGSGISVGLIGGLIGVHWSLGLSAAALLAATVGLYFYTRTAPD